MGGYPHVTFSPPLRHSAVLLGVTERLLGLGESRGQGRCCEGHADGERRDNRRLDGNTHRLFFFSPPPNDFAIDLVRAHVLGAIRR